MLIVKDLFWKTKNKNEVEISIFKYNVRTFY